MRARCSEERLDAERDLLGVGRGRQHLVEEARAALALGERGPRKTKRTPWARGLARRISASFCASISARSTGAITASGTSASAASSAAAPCGAKAVAKPRAAHASPMRLRARRVPVGDQDRAAHAAIRAALPTRPPGCRDPGRAGRSGARRARGRSCGRASRGRPRRPARGAARRASPRRSRSGTAPACRRGAATPT